MWSALRQIAATTVKASRAGAAHRLGSSTSRVSLNRTTPVGYLFSNQVRSFTATRGRSTKQAGAKTGTATRKRATKKNTLRNVPPKAAPKKRVRKVLTPEEKRQVEIRELKKAALLKQPPKLPDRTWTVYVAQNVKGTKPGAEGLPATVTLLSQSYKSLSDSEVQVCYAETRLRGLNQAIWID